MEGELAASLARRLGLTFDDGVVLGEGTNVLVHLRPAPVVARVSRLDSPDAAARGAGGWGPREWDIACMIHRWAVFGELEPEMRTALVAYGACDMAAVEALQPLVVLGIAAWGSLAPLIGETSPRTAHRLEWLRRH